MACHSSSRLTRASSAGGPGAPAATDGIGGHSRSRVTMSCSTRSGGSRTPHLTSSRIKSFSPSRTTRSRWARTFRRPASTSSGTTSVGAKPTPARTPSTALVWSSSLRTWAEASASSRQSRPRSTRTSARQVLTSITNTPPGPTKRTSMLARRVSGQRRSASTCQAASIPARTRTTACSPRPPFSQARCWRRSSASSSVSWRICRWTDSISGPNAAARPSADGQAGESSGIRLTPT
jgi:hypothetical protein